MLDNRLAMAKRPGGCDRETYDEPSELVIE